MLLDSLSHVLFLGWQTTVSTRGLSLSVFPLFWRWQRMLLVRSKHSFFSSRHTAIIMRRAGGFFITRAHLLHYEQ